MVDAVEWAAESGVMCSDEVQACYMGGTPL